MTQRNAVALIILIIGLATVYLGHSIEGVLICVIAGMHAE